VLDGAVVLAQLDADAVRGGRRGVAVGGQRVGERRGPVRRCGPGELLGVALLELGDPGLREALDRGLPRGLGEEAQRACRQVVVRRRAAGVTCVGQHVQPGRPATAARAADMLRARGHGAVGEQRVEVLADGRRAQAQALAEGRGRGRTQCEQQRSDPLTGGRAGRLRGRGGGCRELFHVFHNASVT
jgi:hypothetical protein